MQQTSKSAAHDPLEKPAHTPPPPPGDNDESSEVDEQEEPDKPIEPADPPKVQNVTPAKSAQRDSVLTRDESEFETAAETETATVREDVQVLWGINLNRSTFIQV